MDPDKQSKTQPHLSRSSRTSLETLLWQHNCRVRGKSGEDLKWEATPGTRVSLSRSLCGDQLGAKACWASPIHDSRPKPLTLTQDSHHLVRSELILSRDDSSNLGLGRARDHQVLILRTIAYGLIGKQRGTIGHVCEVASLGGKVRQIGHEKQEKRRESTT